MNQQLTFKIILQSPPPAIDFGLQKGSGNTYETIQVQQFSGKDMEFEFPVTVKINAEGVPNFLGPFVQGPILQRFIYIDIGTYAGQKNTTWSRRLKIPLSGITLNTINEALADQQKILATKVPGTGKDKGPNCATVKPFDGWQIVTRPIR